jgi:hypothetical protein
MRVFALLFALLANPVLAQDPCEDWWFTRNMIFDRGGYCFASPLGQAIFDNAGCTPGDPKLDAAATAQVAQIILLEQTYDCDIDTSRRSLSIPNLDLRQTMEVIATRSEYESGCYGWRGPEIVLRAGPYDDSPVTGVIPTGGDIVWTFEGVPGWSFVVDPYGGPDMGWFRDYAGSAEQCERSAG